MNPSTIQYLRRMRTHGPISDKPTCRSTGKQFIVDLVHTLQNRNKRSRITYAVKQGALSFNLTKTLGYLQSQGNRYDGLTSKKMTPELKALGATAGRMKINGVDARCWTLPKETLDSLGLDVSGLKIPWRRRQQHRRCRMNPSTIQYLRRMRTGPISDASWNPRCPAKTRPRE